MVVGQREGILVQHLGLAYLVKKTTYHTSGKVTSQ